MAKTVLNVKTDVDVKRDAQRLAKNIGVPLSTIVNAQLKRFISDGKVEFSAYSTQPLTIEDIKQKTAPVFKKYGVDYAALYGSYARGEAKVGSDVDLLLRFTRPLGLEYFDLREDLEIALGRDVDTITEDSMNQFLRPYITPDLTTIYGEK